MHNVSKWSDSFWKSCNISCKICKVCLIRSCWPFQDINKRDKGFSIFRNCENIVFTNIYKKVRVFYSNTKEILVICFFGKKESINLIFSHQSKFTQCIMTYKKCNSYNINFLSANPTKWSNTLKQFVGKLPTNCLSVFDHFVKWALKELKCFAYSEQITELLQTSRSYPLGQTSVQRSH